jgi:hypothetical protein
MLDEPNKRKSGSHTKKLFYDLLLQIPIIGKPTHNLLKSKGGFMKKLGAFSLIAIAIIVLVWLHYEHNGQQTTNNNKTASTDGNNSPAITGNNNALIQNSPGATLNYGLSDDTYKHIREGMEAEQKLKDIELRTYFKYGYILFTATERNEIVPLKSPMNDIITFDFNTGYNITYSDKTINLDLPTISYKHTKLILVGFTVKVPKDGTVISPYYFDEYRIAFKAISAKEDSAIIAMGIIPNPDN